MSAYFLNRKALAAVCACLLAGCKTPQPAIDQANNGAALTLSLQTELTRMRTLQGAIAKARLDSVRRQRAMMAEYAADSAFDERIRKVVGDNAQEKLVNDLLMLSDSRATDEDELGKALAALDADMAAVLAPVPDQNGRLAATQKAMAELGTQLPLEQRARILAGFASELKEEIDKHRKAADTTAPAPVQSGPAGVATD